MKLTRRQLLLGGLSAGVAATGIHEFIRLRRAYARQATLTDLALRSPRYIEESLNNAFTADVRAAESIQEIQSSVNLTPPTMPYERDISKILIQCSRLSTEQYLTGKFDPNYDGSITTLPSWSDRLSEFTQVASIKGPDQAEVTTQLDVSGTNILQYTDPLQEDVEQIQNTVQKLAGRTVKLSWSSPVYWGFMLASERGNILVYRGTQRGNEWLQTVRASQITNSQQDAFEFRGKVHHGFAKIYSDLAAPTREAARTLDTSVPLYISGHSLGSPLATLAAMDIALQIPALTDQLRLYSYAGPRVGNPDFADAYSALVPNSYRIVNLADPTPLLPPNSAGGATYVHVGELWGFVSEAGDIGSHHYVSTYRAAVEKEVETNQQRNYPVSGLN
jgi:predicted lipase